jgi:hypothetical protein
MKYKLDLAPKARLYAPPITGAIVTGAIVTPTSQFLAWQPSTWPAPPAEVDEKFIYALKQVFEESILGEISNVLVDVQKANGSLQNRGHVLAIAMLSALDAIASYGYRGHRVKKFIEAHFPPDYHTHAAKIFDLYRNSMIHSWNLFEASIYPDDSKVRSEGSTLAFGLLHFFDALVNGTSAFLERLATDAALQSNTLGRYHELKRSANP